MADPTTIPNARGVLSYDNCRNVMPQAATKKADKAEKTEVKTEETTETKAVENESAAVDQMKFSTAVWDFSDRQHCWPDDVRGLENSCARFGLYPYAD